MKDIAHHKEKFQRKIIRDARQEGEKEEESKEGEAIFEESAPADEVEVEELPVLCRPKNKKIH